LKALKSVESIIGIIILLIGVFVFITSRQFPPMPEGHPGPGLFPSVIGVCFIICGALQLLSSFRSSEIDSVGFSGDWIKVVLMFVVIFVFPFVKEFLGFLPSISIAVFVVGLLMRLPVLHAVLAAIGTTGFIYLIFDLTLHVPL